MEYHSFCFFRLVFILYLFFICISLNDCHSLWHRWKRIFLPRLKLDLNFFFCRNYVDFNWIWQNTIQSLLVAGIWLTYAHFIIHVNQWSINIFVSVIQVIGDILSSRGKMQHLTLVVIHDIEKKCFLHSFRNVIFY